MLKHFCQPIICFLLLVSLTYWIAVAIPANAQNNLATFHLAQVGNSVEQLHQQHQQIEQQRSQISEERRRLKSLEKAAQNTLTGMQKTIQTTASQVKTSEAEQQKAVNELKLLEGKLAQADQAYQQKRFSTIARLQFLQRQKLDQGWAVLLQSQSLNEFLDRRYQLKRVYQSDRQILLSLKTDADRLEQQRNLVEQKKNEIALMNQQLLTQKADIESQVLYQKSSIERLKTDRRAMEVAEAQLEQDSQNIGALIHQKIGRGSNVAFRGTGEFLIPCLGEITSPFGWRMHPVLGYERFHAGLDIGADYGTTIYAADIGTVIFAGWYGGYGNAVIIDHGGAITTLYGHTSELYVVEGQTVQRGQAIAAVGSTGLSTGPHLHFEVRRDGEPIDPAIYL